ncbi:hypothetical protein [Streptomyces apocyni]|uniref:hypothetical protein n=1 Tax=Streptomyces apocyni TaxID=2654677 RepID=UPI0018CFFDC4|nr:hypothetical protein [Streptomyces apocyni]
MKRIEEILSRARLVRDRTVPPDRIPPARTTITSREPLPAGDAHAADSTCTTAAEDLRALCETLVTHTLADDVAEFVTEQLPQPRSAMILACVLQLTDTDDGARFWWQYAAGGGQAAAAYCLYLHHLALGEKDAAHWWHQQTNDVHTPAGPGDQPAQPTPAAQPWHPAGHQVTNASTTTMLRVLRHLAKRTARPPSAVVSELMAYIPTAVAAGYLRQPEMDLPMPGPDFAHRISALLDAAEDRPAAPGTRPARQPLRTRTPLRPRPTASAQPAPMGESATR